MSPILHKTGIRTESAEYKLMLIEEKGDRNMSIGTSKKILKIFGILGIIMGILAIVGGVMAIGGGGMVARSANPRAISDEEAMAAGAMLLGGIVFVVTGIIAVIEGICSLRAAKDSSKIMPAWVFAIIGIISSVVSLVFNLRGDISAIAGAVVTVAINVLIFIAANTIKKSR